MSSRSVGRSDGTTHTTPTDFAKRITRRTGNPALVYARGMQTGLPHQTLRVALGVLTTRRQELDEHIRLIEEQLMESSTEGFSSAAASGSGVIQNVEAPKAVSRQRKSRRKPAAHHSTGEVAAPSKPRGISSAGRKRIAAAQRKRWAEVAAAKGEVAEQPTKRRGRKAGSAKQPASPAGSI